MSLGAPRREQLCSWEVLSGPLLKCARIPRAHAFFVCQAAPSALCFPRRKWRVLLCLGHFLPAPGFSQVLSTSLQIAFSCRKSVNHGSLAPWPNVGTHCGSWESLFSDRWDTCIKTKIGPICAGPCPSEGQQRFLRILTKRVCLYVFMYIYVNNSFPSSLEGEGKISLFSHPQKMLLCLVSLLCFLNRR